MTSVKAAQEKGPLGLIVIAVPTISAFTSLLGFGTDVEVLAPLSLRQHFAQTAAAILRLYNE